MTDDADELLDLTEAEYEADLALVRDAAYRKGERDGYERARQETARVAKAMVTLNGDGAKFARALEELTGGTVRKGEWSEDKHPRDHGKFSSSEGGSAESIHPRIDSAESRTGAPAKTSGAETIRGINSADAHAQTLATRIAEVPHALATRVREFVNARYAKLSARYGEAGAKAILGATVALLPLPIPGSSLLPVAIAEAILRIRRAAGAVMSKAVGGLDASHIEALAKDLLHELTEEMGEAFEREGGSNFETPQTSNTPDDEASNAPELERLLVALDAAIASHEGGRDPQEAIDALLELADDPEEWERIAGGTVEKAWSEDKHPRGKDGRFLPKDQIEAAKSDPAKADELRARVKPEDKDKLEDALSGKTDLRNSREERRDATKEKRERVRASRTEAKRIADAIQKNPDGVTPEQAEALVPHLAALTHAELSYLRTMLSTSGASFGGATRLEERRQRLAEWVKGKVEGGRGATDLAPAAQAGDNAAKPAEEAPMQAATADRPAITRDGLEAATAGTDWHVSDAGETTGDFVLRRADGRTIEAKPVPGGYTVTVYQRDEHTPGRGGTRLNVEVMNAAEHTGHRIIRAAGGRATLTPGETAELLSAYPKDNPAPTVSPPSPAAPVAPTAYEMPPAPPKPFLESLRDRKGRAEVEKLRAALAAHGLGEDHAKRVHDLSYDNPGTRQQAMERAAKYVASTLKQEAAKAPAQPAPQQPTPEETGAPAPAKESPPAPQGDALAAAPKTKKGRNEVARQVKREWDEARNELARRHGTREINQHLTPEQIQAEGQLRDALVVLQGGREYDGPHDLGPVSDARYAGYHAMARRALAALRGEAEAAKPKEPQKPEPKKPPGGAKPKPGKPKAGVVAESALASNPGADKEALRALAAAAPTPASREALLDAEFNVPGASDESAAGYTPAERRRKTVERLGAAWRDALATDAEAAKHLEGVLTQFGAELHGPAAGGATEFDGRYYDSDQSVASGRVTVVRPPVVVKYADGSVHVATRGKVERAASASLRPRLGRPGGGERSHEGSAEGPASVDATVADLEAKIEGGHDMANYRAVAKPAQSDPGLGKADSGFGDDEAHRAADAQLDELLADLKAKHTPAELKEIAKRVTGKAGRKADGSDSLELIRTDLSAVRRLARTQVV